MDGYRYDDEEESSILFKPISPEERLSHAGRKPLRPAERFAPPKPGQLYGSAYSSTPSESQATAAPQAAASPPSWATPAPPRSSTPPPSSFPPLGKPAPLRPPVTAKPMPAGGEGLAAPDAAPAKLSAPTFATAHVTSAAPVRGNPEDGAKPASTGKTNLPAYLKKRPSLSPPHQDKTQSDAPGKSSAGRIASTFGTEHTAPAEEPLFSAAPPHPAQDRADGYPQQHNEDRHDTDGTPPYMPSSMPPYPPPYMPPPYMPPPMPHYKPYYPECPVYDEVAAFFAGDLPYGIPHNAPPQDKPAQEQLSEHDGKKPKRIYPSGTLNAFDSFALNDGSQKPNSPSEDMGYGLEYDATPPGERNAAYPGDDGWNLDPEEPSGYGAEYELESLPESAELPPDIPVPEEMDYQPPVYDPQPESVGGTPLYEPFDPYEVEPMYPPQPSGPPPAPAYVPDANSATAATGKAKKGGSPQKSLWPTGSKKKPKKQSARPSQGSGQNAPPKPPIKWERVAALVAAAAMLIFCAVAGGRIIYHMATNERTMRQVKQAYQEQRGSSLTEDAVRVELPPAGVTFEPTVAPTPQLTPNPVVNAAIAPAATDDPANGDGMASQDAASLTQTETPILRSKLSRYPHNTLRSVLDSMKALQSEYPEAIGRLVIPGVLDEVVMQRNNTYYLTHNYRGTLADGGAVYADESCSIKTPPENLLLRGQGSVAGKVFAPLWQYKTGGQSFVAGAATATLTTLYEEATYLLLAVIVADSDPSSPDYFNYASHPTFATDEQMMSYVQEAMQHSLYRFSTTVEPGDRLLTLATVSSAGDSQCMVLIYRMARENEGR